MDMISIEEAKKKTDKECLAFLREQWGIAEGFPICVWGELSVSVNKDTNYHHHMIKKVKLVDTHTLLEYPLEYISDTEKNFKGISKGIYVPPELNFDIKSSLEENQPVPIKCELELSSIKERIKHNSPLQLAAKPASVEIMDKIRKDEIIKDDDGNILIDTTVINYFKEKDRKQIDDNNRQMEEDYLSKISILTDKIVDLELKTTDHEKEYNSLIHKIGAEKNNIGKLTLEASNVNEEIEVLNSKKQNLKQQIATEKEAHMQRIEKFRSFLKNKADSLLSLEFIDEKQYKEILEIHSSNDQEQENHIDFKHDLNANFSHAISHIQAYLFNKDIIYPKYILEDYFSLIQTNDLIILAGDSGSGKTNLVKSFADAIGGVSKIIPVKPSWTSSEDLLGYYNPLQKTYLSTPFLEALIEASQNPEIPYFICLDEMNLARVEYYFADFLSLLEEREGVPDITLYPDDESNYVLNEFNNVILAIETLQEKYDKKNISNFFDILKDKDINNELKAILGLSDKVSLISYHSTLRRMLGGILSTPSSIKFPGNVRIIGAINIDETTHYLSPKVLDRAHVIKFDNPLLADWNAIEDEVNESNIEKPDYKLSIGIDYFGERKPYPKFSKDNQFCSHVIDLTKNLFNPLGVEIGFRTIRQGMNYKESFHQFNESEKLAFNNFILHKILPKFTFDSTTSVGDTIKSELVKDFKQQLENILTGGIEDRAGRNAINELTKMLKKSEENDGVLNYWA